MTHESEINRKLDLHTRMLARLHGFMVRLSIKLGDEEMALSQDVQNLIDKVAQNNSLVGSVNQAMQVQEKQIADLKSTLASVQPGQPIDAEDLAAIQKAVGDLAATNTALQQAVPANIASTGVDANGNPVTPGTSAQPGTTPGDPGDVAPTSPAV